MKVLKYIAVLAATLLACSTYAAGEAAPVNVVVNNDNGVLHVSVTLNVTNPTETSEEAVKAALKAALNSVGADTLNGRAISAAMIAIKSALADPNASALGSVSVSFAISNKVDGADNVANVKTIATIAGDVYEANTETRFNPETQVASTQGNVSSKASAAAKPVIMTVDANGKRICIFRILKSVRFPAVHPAVHPPQPIHNLLLGTTRAICSVMDLSFVS